MGFVIDNGKISDGNLGGDFGAGDGLVGGGSNKREKRNKQCQGKIHVFIVREGWEDVKALSYFTNPGNLTIHLQFCSPTGLL